MNTVDFASVMNISAMNIVDYIIIAFVLWGAVKGYRKGMAKGLFCFLSWAAAAAAAYFLAPIVVSRLDTNIAVTETLKEIIRNKMPVEAVAEGSFLQGFSLSRFDFSGLGQYVQEVWAASPENAGGLADVLSQQAASLLAHGFGFVILMLGVFLILRLIIRFIARGLRGTFLGLLNRLGGMLFGTGVNIVVAGLVVGLLTPWLVLGTWEKGGFLYSFSGLLSKSVIAPFFSYLFLRVSAALAGMPF